MDQASNFSTGSRREQKKRETHQRILQCAVALFVERGFDGTTVEEIAAAAGVSKPTFFNYFRSKTSLLTALIDQNDQAIINKVGASVSGNASLSQRLSSVFETTAKIYSANRPLADILVNHGLLEFHRQHPTPKNGRLRVFLTQLLMAGRDAGEFNQDDDLQLQYQLVFGLYINTLVDWVLEADGATLDVRMNKAAAMSADKLRCR